MDQKQPQRAQLKEFAVSKGASPHVFEKGRNETAYLLDATLFKALGPLVTGFEKAHETLCDVFQAMATFYGEQENKEALMRLLGISDEQDDSDPSDEHMAVVGSAAAAPRMDAATDAEVLEKAKRFFRTGEELGDRCALGNTASGASSSSSSSASGRVIGEAVAKKLVFHTFLHWLLSSRYHKDADTFTVFFGSLLTVKRFGPDLLHSWLCSTVLVHIKSFHESCFSSPDAAPDVRQLCCLPRLLLSDHRRHGTVRTYLNRMISTTACLKDPNNATEQLSQFHSVIQEFTAVVKYDELLLLPDTRVATFRAGVGHTVSWTSFSLVYDAVQNEYSDRDDSDGSVDRVRAATGDISSSQAATTGGHDDDIKMGRVLDAIPFCPQPGRNFVVVPFDYHASDRRVSADQALNALRAQCTFRREWVFIGAVEEYRLERYPFAELERDDFFVADTLVSGSKYTLLRGHEWKRIQTDRAGAARSVTRLYDRRALAELPTADVAFDDQVTLLGVCPPCTHLSVVFAHQKNSVASMKNCWREFLRMVLDDTADVSTPPAVREPPCQTYEQVNKLRVASFNISAAEWKQDQVGNNFAEALKTARPQFMMFQGVHELNLDPYFCPEFWRAIRASELVALTVGKPGIVTTNNEFGLFAKPKTPHSCSLHCGYLPHAASMSCRVAFCLEEVAHAVSHNDKDTPASSSFQRREAVLFVSLHTVPLRKHNTVRSRRALNATQGQQPAVSSLNRAHQAHLHAVRHFVRESLRKATALEVELQCNVRAVVLMGDFNTRTPEEIKELRAAMENEAGRLRDFVVSVANDGPITTNVGDNFFLIAPRGSEVHWEANSFRVSKDLRDAASVRARRKNKKTRHKRRKTKERRFDELKYPDHRVVYATLCLREEEEEETKKQQDIEDDDDDDDDEEEEKQQQ